MAENPEEAPIFNFEKLSEVISFYKLPLVLAAIGTALSLISIIILFKPQFEDSSVEFSTDASESGKTSKRMISIDIEGEVKRPGVYDFSEGERISDAIEKAGGLTNDADLDWIEKNINKAAKLADGGKIYIPKKSESGIMNIESGIKNTGLININIATKAELE